MSESDDSIENDGSRTARAPKTQYYRQSADELLFDGTIERNMAELAANQSQDGSQDHEFVNLSFKNDRADNLYEDDATSALASCKKFVVRPQHVLMKVIGWRSFQNPNEQCPRVFKSINTLYPVLIFVMLTFACFAQLITCFSRTKSTPPTPIGDYYILKCSQHLFTLNVIPYVLKLGGYLFALYTFRIAEPESLSSLAETVFLSFNELKSAHSKKKLLSPLLGILMFGFGYFVISSSFSVIRFFGLGLFTKQTIIAWFTSNVTAEDQSEALRLDIKVYAAVQYVLSVCAYIGFLFFDLLYIAVTINYCSQCQLLTFYIDNIQDKVRNKKYDNLKSAMKEMHKVHDFINIVNGKMSVITSLVIYTFLANVILSYVEFVKPEKEMVNIVLGFLNMFQWIFISLLPIIMAVRLTSSGNQLRRLGQEIAARPFYYADTPDLELHSFLIFADATRYQASLAFIPMQPSLVYGFMFVILSLISSGIIIPQVESVAWF